MAFKALLGKKLLSSVMDDDGEMQAEKSRVFPSVAVDQCLFIYLVS